MKIYKLELNEIDEPKGEPKWPISSNYISPRIQKRTEFFVNRVKADCRASDMRSAAATLRANNFEITVTEIEVIE